MELIDKKILIALECSDLIRSAFEELGWDAWSLDLKPSENPNNKKHIQDDVRNHLNDGWFAMIGHPVCKFLTQSGWRWMFHPEDMDLEIQHRRPHPKYPNRKQDQEEGVKLFEDMWNAPIKYKLLENPLPQNIVIERIGNYSQIVHPYFFGDPYQKSTCIWLQNLPPLIPENVVSKGEFVRAKGGQRIPKWYSEAKVSDKEKTSTDRSRTFPGFSKAVARQYDHFFRTGVPFGRLF